MNIKNQFKKENPTKATCKSYIFGNIQVKLQQIDQNLNQIQQNKE